MKQRLGNIANAMEYTQFVYLASGKYLQDFSNKFQHSYYRA